MTTGSPNKVVVIDDERPILMTLEALLKRHGYEALLANTAAAGVSMVRKNAPDLVLLDLGLPDADGLDVLRELRQDWPDTQVIILTAQDSLSNAIDSIKLGAFHFISKPYAPEELLGLMGQALEKRKLFQEAARLRQREKQLS